MEKVGTIGRYQFTTFAIWCVLVYMAGGLTLMIPFLFYQDKYICEESLSDKACIDYVCGSPESSRADFLPESITINSLANEFGNYRCEPEKSFLTTIITIMYAGALLGVFFMALAGDLLSRITLILLNLFMMIVGIAMTAWCANLWMAGIGICLCVFGGKNNFNLSVIFVTETTSKEYRQVLSVLIHTFFCAGGLFNVRWYYFIADYQIVLIYCYGIPSIFVAVCIVAFVKDTPICLLSSYSPEDALKSLAFIARVNNQIFFDLSID